MVADKFLDQNLDEQPMGVILIVELWAPTKQMDGQSWTEQVNTRVHYMYNFVHNRYKKWVYSRGKGSRGRGKLTNIPKIFMNILKMNPWSPIYFGKLKFP